jgi:hypothetical protein
MEHYAAQAKCFCTMASQTYTVLGICCIVTVQALDVAIAVKVYRSSGEA